MRKPLPLLAVLSSFTPLWAAAPSELELKPRDSIAVIGNALAERMQHEGSLDALLHQAFPQHDLTIRNLAFAGDELRERARSENFGSPEQWLTKVKADVVFAFFGFNESFDGPDGLAKFRSDLDSFLKSTKSANYSGKGSPRLVLFSPIAQEKARDPNLPDPARNNANIELYAKAMAEVAATNDVQFVDLLTISREVYAKSGKQLTVNGIHLSDEGFQAIAPAVFQALTGKTAPAVSPKLLEAVRERNSMWFSRYRTPDGYNVYGGRSQLSYGGLSNYKVMQEEMNVRDTMTANREARIWAVAKGGDLVVKDDNLPPVTPVPTNKPDAKPFISGEAAIANMILPKGVQANLYASEEKFPDLANPVQMAWDTKGRLWVCAWATYPGRTPWDPKGDSILIFEDKDGDGKADTCETYLSHLNCPTGFQFYKDGILLMQAPDIWHVETNPATGKAGKITRVLSGLDSADSHHQTNSLVLDPGGAVYPSDGVFHRSQVETHNGPIRNTDAAIFRFEPNTGRFERYAPYGFANPHGRVFDRWGNDFITDATGNVNLYGPAISTHLDQGQHPDLGKVFWQNPSRPCPGTGMISSRVWPEEYRENFLNCNVISFQGIYRAQLSEDGSGVKGTSVEHLLDYNIKADPNFRPVQVNTGPDGALYVADWSNAIIGHMQHHLRDPNRDKKHGRIYRLTYEGKTMTPAKIYGQPVEALLELLKEPENNTRERAKIELGKHESSKVVAAVDKWVASLDKNSPDYQHHLLEALWVKQWHNAVDVSLLKRLLRSPDPRARAAATRVLCYQTDRVPVPLALLKTQVLDEHPQVRLQAVRALSFFRQWEAADLALLALKQPTDHYLDYVLKQTMRQLQPWWKQALAEGKPVAAANPAGVSFVLSSVATPDLGKLPKSESVSLAMMTRADAPPAMRQAALGDIASARKQAPTDVITSTLQPLLSSGGNPVEDLCRLLLQQPAAELKAGRAGLEKLSASANVEARRTARAALMVADGSVESAWGEAQKTPAALADFLGAVAKIENQALKAVAHAKTLSLLSSFPPAISAALAGTKGSAVRYVRVELSGPSTLTLAEVQVFAEGRNIGPQGKARQSSTAYDGQAQRAVDGNTNGTYGAGTSTHTEEMKPDQWWEVDLQGEFAVEAVAVWNRTDDNGIYAKRLDNYQIVALDSERHEVFRSAKLPAPKVSAQTELPAVDRAGSLKRTAIRTLAELNVEPAATFKALAGLIAKGEDVEAAAQALGKLPRVAWARELAPATVKGFVAWSSKVTPAGRLTPGFAKAMKVGDELAALLPANEAAAARAAMTASLAADPESLKRGAEIYGRTCVACHQPNGLGLPGVFPPLGGAEQLLGDASLPIKIVLHGIHGPITVKGQVYQSVEMPPQGALLKDQDIADVLTYARQSFGNSAAPVSAAQVQSIRSATAGRTKPFSTEELGLK